MKRLSAAVAALLFAFAIYAQQDTIPEPPVIDDQIEMDILEELEELDILDEDVLLESAPENTEIKFGENEVFIFQENGDTLRIKLGDKGLSIVEGENGYEVNVMEMDDSKSEMAREDPPEEEGKAKKSKKFKPHFGGFSVGMNNFLNPDYTLHNGTFMNLNTSRSWNYNLNFLEYGIGLGTQYVGLVTGMGFEWSNYIFDGSNSIQEEDDGSIVSRPLDPIDYPNISKSKLTTTYLTAPLILEFQIPAGKKPIHLSAGVIGGVKLGSRTKVKYNDGGKQKDVRKNDYSLSPFRYGATFRIGYRAVNIFANYYITPLFGETDTPEIHPFSVGLTLIPF